MNDFQRPNRTFQQLLEGCDFTTTRSYSSRGMFAKECLAITTHHSVGEIAAQLIRAMYDDGMTHREMSDVAEALEECLEDSLGKGKVIYFPGFKYEEKSQDG